MSKIDWNKPLQVVYKDREVYPARLVYSDRKSDRGLSHIVFFTKNNVEYTLYCKEDGSNLSYAYILRNVPEERWVIEYLYEINLYNNKTAWIIYNSVFPSLEDAMKKSKELVNTVKSIRYIKLSEPISYSPGTSTPDEV